MAAAGRYASVKISDILRIASLGPRRFLIFDINI